MKNNQNPMGHVPINPVLIQAHSSVYRAMADVNLALKILSKYAERGSDPGTYAPGRHSRIEGELRAMLFDIQHMIGRAALRAAEKQFCNKGNKAHHE